jgi:DNA-binding GntR family transcriptional regulator
MSFLPMSEGLMRLELEGLFESSPSAGTGVRIPSRDDVQGHYIVREALETQAARQFARLAKDDSELKRLARRLDVLSRKSNRMRYLQLHEQLPAASWFCWAFPLLVIEVILQGRKILKAPSPASSFETGA